MKRSNPGARMGAWRTEVRRWFRPQTGVLGIERIGALIGLALLILIFTAVSASFRQPGNLIFLMKNVAITIGIVAVGQTVVMISGGIDLSVSSVIALTALISALLMKRGLGPIPPLTGNLSYIAILIAWAIGALIGAGQGWLITRRGIPAFIVTLATMLGLRGIAIGISGAIMYGLPTQFRWMSEGKVGFIPTPFLLMLGLYLVTAYALRRTKIGRYCHAIGGNETAARLAGINVDRYRMLFYAFSGLTAALTGTLLVSNLNAAIYSYGEGYQFTSVAATIIGGTSLTGGVGSIWGTLLGVLILAIIPSGMIMLSAPSWTRDVITATVIILAVIIDVNRTRARKSALLMETAPEAPTTGRHLSDLLGKLIQRIERQAGPSLCRVYLVEPDSGELVQQEVLSTEKGGGAAAVSLGRSRIVNEARETGVAVLVPDLIRTGYQRVTPLSPDMQSALAVPLMNRDRCIGVIELQSAAASGLKIPTLDTVEAVVGGLAPSLEDAWLLESGWLVRQVRDALRHLWDDLHLGRLPLAGWALPDQEIGAARTEGARGEALRNLLLERIESLKPQDNGDSSRDNRTYRILHLTYVEEQAVDQILRLLGISRRQYFYDLKEAIEILTDQMVRNRR